MARKVIWVVLLPLTGGGSDCKTIGGYLSSTGHRAESGSFLHLIFEVNVWIHDSQAMVALLLGSGYF